MVLLGIASAQDTQPATQSSKPAQSTSATQSKTPAAKKPATSATRPSTAVALTTQKQKNSYALGMSIGLGFQKQGIDKSVDSALVVRGLREALAGTKTAMTEDEMKAALQQLRTEVMSAQEAKAKEAGSANRKEGETFLAANKSKDGVKVLPDGLQYKVLTEGSGPKPAATDTVTVNYRGTLINGKEFDSSYKRGEPAEFPLNGVIPCWTEGVQLMKVGGKAKLICPPGIAYGTRGAGGTIPPNATLHFEVELLGIKGK